MAKIVLAYLSGEEEKDEYEEERTLKISLFIKGSRMYVDLFACRFFSTVNIDILERKVYPARRISWGDGNVAFEAKEDTRKYLVFSKLSCKISTESLNMGSGWRNGYFSKT